VPQRRIETMTLTNMINKATFYISKKTNEVLKLEEDFGSGVRYKVRLPGDLLVR
jgi:hypothetical protein